MTMPLKRVSITWLDDRQQKHQDLIYKDPDAARKILDEILNTPEWERQGFEYADLDDIDREIMKNQHERAVAEYNAREAEKIEAERLRNRSTTERMSDDLGENDTLHLDSLEDQYNVVIHRSDKWFKNNAELIYERHGLFVSNHEGFYGTYTKAEMHQQFPDDERYEIRLTKRIENANLKSRITSWWKRSVYQPITSRLNQGLKALFNNDTVICVSMLFGFYFLVFVAVLLTGLGVCFGIPAIVDLLHSMVSE